MYGGGGGAPCTGGPPCVGESPGRLDQPILQGSPDKYISDILMINYNQQNYIQKKKISFVYIIGPQWAVPYTKHL